MDHDYSLLNINTNAFLLDEDLVSPALKKLVTVQTSIEDRKTALQGNIVDKRNDLIGIKHAPAVRPNDGDSYEVSTDGVTWKSMQRGHEDDKETHRLYNPRVGVDTGDFSSDQSPNKYWRQLDFLKKKTGIANPTLEEQRYWFDQIEHWHTIEAYKKAKNPDTYQIQDFDIEKGKQGLYNKHAVPMQTGVDELGNPIITNIDITAPENALTNMYYKAHGVGHYGRVLAEMYAKGSDGQLYNMSDIIGLDPNMNTEFDLYALRNTSANRRKVAYDSLTAREKADLLDNDGALGEFVDQVKSGFAKTWREFKANHTDDPLERKRLLAEATQEATDIDYGVKQSTRLEQERINKLAGEKFVKAFDSLKNGDNSTAIQQIASGFWDLKDNALSIIADSAPQSSAGMLAAMVVGGIFSTFTGGSGALAVAGLLTTKAIASTSATAYIALQQDQIQFEEKNGRQMNREELMDAFATNLVTYSLEGVLDSLELGSIVKTFKGAVKAASLETANIGLKSVGKAIGSNALRTGEYAVAEGLSETIQEPTQNIGQSYNTIPNDQKPDVLSYFKEQTGILGKDGINPEIAGQRALEAMSGAWGGLGMGGITVGTGGIGNVIVSTKNFKLSKDAKNISKLREASANTTIDTNLDSIAQDVLNRNTKDAVFNSTDTIEQSKTKFQTILDSAKEMYSKEGVNKETATTKVNTFFIDALTSLNSIINNNESTAEEKADAQTKLDALKEQMKEFVASTNSSNTSVGSVPMPLSDEMLLNALEKFGLTADSQAEVSNGENTLTEEGQKQGWNIIQLVGEALELSDEKVAEITDKYIQFEETIKGLGLDSKSKEDVRLYQLIREEIFTDLDVAVSTIQNNGVDSTNPDVIKAKGFFRRMLPNQLGKILGLEGNPNLSNEKGKVTSFIDALQDLRDNPRKQNSIVSLPTNSKKDTFFKFTITRNNLTSSERTGTKALIDNIFKEATAINEAAHKAGVITAEEYNNNKQKIEEARTLKDSLINDIIGLSSPTVNPVEKHTSKSENAGKEVTSNDVKNITDLLTYYDKALQTLKNTGISILKDSLYRKTISKVTAYTHRLAQYLNQINKDDLFEAIEKSDFNDSQKTLFKSLINKVLDESNTTEDKQTIINKINDEIITDTVRHNYEKTANTLTNKLDKIKQSIRNLSLKTIDTVQAELDHMLGTVQYMTDVLSGDIRANKTVEELTTLLTDTIDAFNKKKASLQATTGTAEGNEVNTDINIQSNEETVGDNTDVVSGSNITVNYGESTNSEDKTEGQLLLDKAITALKDFTYSLTTRVKKLSTKSWDSIVDYADSMRNEFFSASENPHNSWIFYSIYKNSTKKVYQKWSNALKESFDRFAPTFTLEEFSKELKNNPAYALIYSFKEVEDGKVKLEFNKDIVPLIGAAIFEFICSQQYSNIVSPTTESDALNGYNKDENISDKEKEAIFRDATTVGLPLDKVASELGKVVFKHLNLKVNKKGTGYASENGFVTTEAVTQSTVGNILLNILSNSNVLPYITNNSSIVNNINDSIIVFSQSAVTGQVTVRLNPSISANNTFKVEYTPNATTQAMFEQFNSKSQYVVFDTETASKGDGINPNNSPIQLVYTVYNSNGSIVTTAEHVIELEEGYEIAEKFDNVVNPMYDYHRESTNKVSFKQAIESFAEAVGDKLLVGHNIVSYDLPLLINSINRWNTTHPNDKISDSIRTTLEKALVENKNGTYANALDTLKLAQQLRGSNKSNKLEDLGKEYNVRNENVAHNALTDVSVNRGVLDHLLQYASTNISNDSRFYNTQTYRVLRNMYFNIKKECGLKEKKEEKIYTSEDKISHNPEHTVRHSYGLLNLSEGQNKVLDRFFQEEFTLVDVESIANALSETNIDKVKEVLGYSTPMQLSNMSKSRRRSAEGVNQSIDTELEGLQKVLTIVQSGNKLKFSRFFGRNGRIYVNGQSINFQSYKRLQRFLIASEKQKVSFNTSNLGKQSKERTAVLFTVAQTFKLFNANEETVSKITDKLLSTDIKTLDSYINSVLTDKSFTKVKEDLGISKIENLGQSIALFNFFKEYQKSENNKFKAYLPVEIDSSSSGVAIKLQQYAIPSIVKNLGLSAGLVLSNNADKSTTMHGLKQSDSTFKDIYQHIGELLFNNLTGESYEKTLSSSVSDNDKTILSEMFTDYNLICHAMVKVAESKGKRDFVKDPVMTHNYSAGIKSIIRSMSEILLTDCMEVFDNWYTGDKKTKNNITNNESTKAQLEFILKIAKKFGGIDTFRKLTKDNSNNEVYLTTKNGTNISLYDIFNTITRATFESTLQTILNKEFAFSEYNTHHNRIAALSFNLFKTTFSDRLEKLNKEYGERVPLTVYKTMMEDLKELFPTIAPIVDKRVSPLLFVKQQWDISNTNEITNSLLQGDGSLFTQEVHPEKGEWIQPGLSSAVISIHNIDEYIDELTHSIMPEINSIFDAYVVNAMYCDEIAKAYNTNSILFNMSYNLTEEFHNLLMKTVEAMKKIDKADSSYYLASTKMVDQYGNSTDETLEDFIKYSEELLAKVNTNREALYGKFTNGIWDSKQFTRFQNMDSIAEGYADVDAIKNLFAENNIQSFKDIRDYLQRKNHSNIVGSTFMSNIDTFNRKGELLVDSTDTLNPTKALETRLAIFDKLLSEDINNGLQLDEENHINVVRKLLQKANPVSTLGIKVVKYVNDKYTQGIANIDKREIILDIKEIDGNSTLTEQMLHHVMGRAETYAHELLHVTSNYSLRSIGSAHKLYKQLYTLWDKARRSNEITSDIFLPSNYDSLTKVEQQAARDVADNIYKYIFTVKSKDSLHRNLEEFLSYGLSNASLMSVLRRLPVKEANTNTTLFQKLWDTAVGIFDVVFRGKAFSEVFKNTDSVLTGNVSILAKDNTYEQLATLYQQLTNIDAKYIEKTMNTNQSTLNKVNQAVSKFWNKANDATANTIHKYITERTYNPTIPTEYLNFHNTSTFRKVLKTGKITYDFITDRGKRTSLLAILRAQARFAQEGVLMSVVKDVLEPDIGTKQLHERNAARVTIEQNAKAAESVTLTALKNAYGRDLTDLEASSVNKLILKTDLQCLTDQADIKGYKYSDIVNFINNTESRNNEIKNIITRLKELRSNKSEVLFMTQQAQALAYYMHTKRGTEGLLTNAHQIVRRATGNTNDETVVLVNRLATLYALSDEYINEETRLIFNTLPQTGNIEAIAEHKRYVEDAYYDELDSFVNADHIIKGYVKPRFDGVRDVLIAPKNQRDMLLKKGYKPLTTKEGYHLLTGEAHKDLLIYIRSFTTPNTISGGAIAMAGTNHTIWNWENSAYEMLADRQKYPTKESYMQLNTKRMSEIAEKEVKRFFSPMNMENYKKRTGGYITLRNKEGKVDDYTITVDSYISENILGESQNGLENLAAMRGNAYRKVHSAEANAVVIEFLRQYAEKNMIVEGNQHRLKSDILDIHSSATMPFVQLKAPSKDTDPYIAKIWDKLPISIKQNVMQKPLWIRADWKLDVFGTLSSSIADNAFIEKYTPVAIRAGIAMGEQIMKFMGDILKHNIIFRTPFVLRDNIAANIMLSAVTHNNPLKVISYQRQAWVDTSDYIKTEEKVLELERKNKVHGLSSDEFNTLRALKGKLERNPVHPLMKAGMFSGIVKDLEQGRKDIAGFRKKVLDNTVTKHTPNAVKKVLKEVWLAEGTFLYEQMYKATQFSDFVARVAEYRLFMEKGRNSKGLPLQPTDPEYTKYSEAVIKELRYKFINYDLPVSSKEQYLNDLGIVNFTKFRKRIQWVAMNLINAKPVNAILALAFAHSLVDVDNPISDIGPNGLHNFYSPVDILSNVFNPGINHFTGTSIF